MQEKLASLPVSLDLPSPPAPDALICAGSQKRLIGVEVTGLRWQRLREVSNAAKPGDVLEITPELLVNQSARRDRNAPKGSRSMDFSAIKKPGERPNSTGMTGDETRAAVVTSLKEAIAGKQAKLAGYQNACPVTWLCLTDFGIGVSWWSDILERSDLSYVKQQVRDICANSGFDRVLLHRSQRNLVALL